MILHHEHVYVTYDPLTPRVLPAYISMTHLPFLRHYSSLALTFAKLL